MRALFLGIFWLTVFAATTGLLAAEAKIVKVLPHYVDEQGRHALSPSLYDRDAYQAFLRRNPQHQSALRFDVQWKAKASKQPGLKLWAEVRGSNSITPVQIEMPVNTTRRGARWSALKLEGNDFRALGKPVAWRVSLRDGDQIVTEQKSFLW